MSNAALDLSQATAATGIPASARQSGSALARDRTLAERVRLLHDNALLSQFVALLNGSILGYVLWNEVEHARVVAWLACLFCVSLLRLGEARAFAAASDTARGVRFWRNCFLVGASASGLTWGAAALLLFPEHSLPHQGFVAFVIAGMVAGSVATLSPVMSAFGAFGAPALLPIVLQFLLRGGELYFPMSFMAVLFGLAMVAVARHVNASVRIGLEASVRNAELVEVLKTAKEHTEELNQQLLTEVAHRREKEEALRANEESLAEAQRMAHLGSWTYDPVTHRAVWSDETYRLYGLAPGAAAPSCWQLLTRLHAEDRRRVYGLLKRALSDGEGYETEFRLTGRNGAVRWVHALGQPIIDAAGKVILLRGTVLDITERKRQERLLDSERRVMRAMVAGAPLNEALDLLCQVVEEQLPGAMAAVVQVDAATGRLQTRAAPSLSTAYLRAIEAAPAGAGCAAISTRDRRRVIASDLAKAAGDHATALRVGLRACWSTPVPGAEDAILGALDVYFREPRRPTRTEAELIERAADVARIAIERSEAERRIQQLAHYDPLTGLPNRALFGQALEHALRRAERASRSLALLFVDVDRFKNINDTLGHDAGDRLLQEAGARLRQSLRASDIVARFGGDEFIVLLEDLPQIAYVTSTAAKLRDVLADAVRIDGQEFHVTASIGIAIYPDDGRDAQTLQKNADIAMYRAKDQGRNGYCFYSPHANVHSLERLTMEAQLRRALERDELEVHYQPKQDLASGAITGVEALVRWRNPELGTVSPARFIPLAEETGLIVPIGEWVLRTACSQMTELQKEAWGAGLHVAVNLSARQFVDQRLPALVAEILGSTRLASENLELEITESLVMQNPELATRMLREIKSLGVSLAMDDFGTGYSSLAYLKRFPVDSIKIDRSFIHGIPGDADGASITQAVIAMAHSLRLHAVAEGVENAQQLQFLREHRCDEIQGYFLSKPLPFAQLRSMLAAQAAQPHASRPAPIGVPVWP